MAEHTIAQYTIIERLGEGGMGVVYKARDRRLDRFVALKILPVDKTANAERRQRLVREAKAASALNHPNIVTVHEINEADGVYFICMEYVEGHTLDRLIPRKGMRVGDVLRYSVQIADALACAHRSGIVHRDLKPGNVMVTGRGLVKVVDFGLAKLSEPEISSEFGETRTVRESRSALTEEGQILGTVAYMSPEQAEGKPVDSRSDVFSIGCLMYEMLTGRRAFQRETKVRTLSAILTHEPVPASQIAEDVPPELERIVSRCLRKEPARRFQHMDDLKIALEELKEESDSGKLRRAPTPAKFGARHARAAAFAVALGVFLLLAFVTWVWRSSTKDDAISHSHGPPVAVTTYAGTEERVALSPDGKQVAFSGNVEQRDNFDIYVKMIGSEPSLRLTRNPDADSWPAWSPDGRWIAFTRAGRKLLLVSPLGGAERVVAEGEMGRSTWSEDSQSLLVETVPKPGQGRQLVVISIVTGQSRVLVRDAGMPSVSHAGHKLAYVCSAAPQRLYVAPLSAQIELGTPLLIDWAKPFQVLGCAWAEGDRDLVCAFRQHAGDTPALWRIDTEKPSPPRILPFSEGAADPEISVAARRLVFDRFKADSNIWRAPNPEHSPQASASPAPFISSTKADSAPRYSPDGSQIAFQSSRSGQAEIWVAAEDGSAPRMITSSGGAGPPQWSCDSKSVVFAREGEVYVVDSAGGVPKHVAPDPAVKAFSPSYSRDGRWIYFACNRDGKVQIWRMPVAGGAAVQLTAEDGTQPIERPDGLFFLRTEATKASLWRMPAGGGPQQRLFEFPESTGYPRAPQVAFATHGVYCIRYDHPDRPAGIDFVDLGKGAIHRVLTLEMPQRFTGSGLSVSPDGRWFLCVLYDFEDDIMQYENFR